MTDTQVTDLTAELAAIRGMAAQITDDGHPVAECVADLGARCTGHDAERLADAVEAVLARHRPGRNVIVGSTCSKHENHRFFSITAYEAADVAACPDCPATVYVSCEGCGPQMPLERCPEQLAITKAMLGDAPATEPAKCICRRFSDTGGFRVGDLCCPVHGVNGTEPLDGPWEVPADEH